MAEQGSQDRAGVTARLTAALRDAVAALAESSSPGPERILIGFSGGRDSTVLLHVAATLWPGRVTAHHVNHALHPHSDQWQSQCEALAHRLGVAFVNTRVKVEAGSNLEARARRARYAAMAEQMQPGDCLLLAHHGGDQVESRLLHLFQGRGLFGIPAGRSFADGYLLRPFLDVPPDVLDSYANEYGLQWIEDPSNADLTLDRNYLRQEVVPRLEARFPYLARRLDRVQTQWTAASNLLDELLGLDRHPLPLEVLDGRDAATRQLILRQWLMRLERSRGYSDAALADFLRQLEAPDDRQPEVRANSNTLRRYRESLYVVDDLPPLAERYSAWIPGRLTMPHGTLVLDRVPQQQAEHPADSAADPGETVEVRFLDSCGGGQVPKLELRGHSRSVSELLRAAGVPPWERASYPLLMDARGLLALPGIAVRDSGSSTGLEEEKPRLSSLWQPFRGVPRRM